MSNIDPRYADLFRRARLEETYMALSKRADVAYNLVCRAFRERVCNDVDAEKIRKVLGDQFIDGNHCITKLTIVPTRKAENKELKENATRPKS